MSSINSHAHSLTYVYWTVVPKQHFALTIICVIKDDKLLPGVLHHHMEDDIIQVDRGPDKECVVIRLPMAGWRAAGARGSCWCLLDKQVGDVHGIGQSLK